MASIVVSSFPRSLHVINRNGRYNLHACRLRALLGLGARPASCPSVRMKSSAVTASLVDERFLPDHKVKEKDLSFKESNIKAPNFKESGIKETIAKDSLDMTFSDHRAAFKSKTNGQLLRAIVVYQLCSIKYLVENNEKIKCSVVMSRFLNDIQTAVMPRCQPYANLSGISFSLSGDCKSTGFLKATGFLKPTGFKN